MFELDSTAMPTPRARRRAATRDEIVAAAWALARSEGLAGISLRALGKRVGLKASSLYAYFDSKGALYDAMFRQAYLELLARSEDWVIDAAAMTDPHRVLVDANRDFFRWCLDDPVRYQLLFQRTIPDWAPSPDSYDLAIAYLERLRTALARIGIVDERAIDMWTAIMSGLIAQQISNDPGGDRWFRLVDDAVVMFLHHFPPAGGPARPGPRRSTTSKETPR